MQNTSEKDSNINSNTTQIINCSCKGIRTCILCEKIKNKACLVYDKLINLTNHLKIEEDNNKLLSENSENIEEKKDNLNENLPRFSISHFYIDELKSLESENILTTLSTAIKNSIEILSHKINLEANKIKFRENIFDGFYLVRDFLSDKDHSQILAEVNSTEWKDSQSGRKKQDYGPKINYKKRKVKYKGEGILSILPPGLKSIIEKAIKDIKCNGLDLKDYKVAGVGNLFYSNKNGSHIEPHVDDVWIWGRRIIGINLLSDTVMTFSIESDPGIGGKKILIEVDIPIKAGDIYIMENKARYIWKHSIKKEFIFSDRIAVTIREFEEEYVLGKDKNEK